MNERSKISDSKILVKVFRNATMTTTTTTTKKHQQQSQTTAAATSECAKYIHRDFRIKETSTYTHRAVPEWMIRHYVCMHEQQNDFRVKSNVWENWRKMLRVRMDFGVYSLASNARPYSNNAKKQQHQNCRRQQQRQQHHRVTRQLQSLCMALNVAFVTSHRWSACSDMWMRVWVCVCVGQYMCVDFCLRQTTSHILYYCTHIHTKHIFILKKKENR